SPTAKRRGARPRCSSAASPGCSSLSRSPGRSTTASAASSPLRARGSRRMTDLELRLPLGLGHQLRELVFARARYEVVAFCLVSHAAVGSTTRLLVRHVMGLNDDDYLATREHGAAWR